MIRHTLLLGAALVATVVPAALAAQAVVQPLSNADADALSAQMRLLASDPRNVQALATAGELSMRLGDLSGAAALFARADKVDPRSGRVKAGMGSILVRSERPGEALRFFSQAEAYGYPAARYAADRGLAFDLVGQQGRAQRDYRLALQNGTDDETTRRYALSLGISGQQAPALAQLDPLVRRQDRAAWRARAFVMAMTGDTAGAAKIATTMMPAGMAQGLASFFGRLPTLGPVDRAFAVHFGEITATPARIADARMTPAYAPLPVEVAAAPVQVAAIVPASTRTPDRRPRRERQPVAVAAAPSRRPVALAAATPQPIGATMREADVRVSTVAPVTVAALPATATVVPAAPIARSPVAVAQVVPATPVTIAARSASPTPAAIAPSASAIAPSVVAAPAPVQVAATPSVQVAAPTPRPVAPVVTTSVAASTPAVAQPVAVAATPTPVTVAAAAPVAPVPTEAATERADSVLARIVASLSIPASELGVVEPARPDPGPVALPAAVERAPSSSAGRRVVAQASAQEGRDAALRRTVAAKLTGDAQADEPVRGARSRRGTATQLAAVEETPTRRTRRGAVVDEVAAEPATARRNRRGVAVEEALDETPARTRGRRGAVEEVALTPAQRRAADRKAVADKKAAAEKKELADKAAAEKKAARGQPARIWVQVAGGANEGDLGKAWKNVQAKTPALKGKSGYATPLRATNRVLTGPFKTDAEARAFVNQLGRQGVSAFSFTSEAGQKVEKLGTEKAGK